MPPKRCTGKRGRRCTTSSKSTVKLCSAASSATPIPSAAEPSILATQSALLVTPPCSAIGPETPIPDTHALDAADTQPFASAAEVLPEPSETSPTTGAASLSPSAPSTETQTNTVRPKRRVVKIVRKIVSSKSKTPVAPTLVSESPALVTPPPPAIASKPPLVAAAPLPPETLATVEAAEEPLKASGAAGPSSQTLSSPNQSQTNTIPVKRRVVKIVRRVIRKTKSKTPAAASAVSPITPTLVAVHSTSAFVSPALFTPPSSAIAYNGSFFAAAPLHHEAPAAAVVEEPPLKSSAAGGASSLNLSNTPTQSETNKMPPKRRVVKIVRKVAPKTKSKPPAAAARFITPTPVTESSISTSVSTSRYTPPSSAIASAKSHRVWRSYENPLAAAVPQPPETLSAAVEAVVKPLKNSVTAGASIVDAIPQSVVVEASAVAPQTEPSGAGEKATKRVRKVVKKIIVKKKIPKVASSEKKDLGSAQQPAEMTHKETLVSKTRLRNISSYAEAGVVRQTENAVAKKDAQKDQEEKTDAQGEQNGMDKASHWVQDKEKIPAEQQCDKKGPPRKVIKKIIVKKKIPKKALLAGTADQETLLSKTGFVNPSFDAGTGEVMQIDNPVIKGKDAFSLKKDKKNGCKEMGVAAEDLMVGQSEWQKRKTEIFIGGLSTDAKEEDVRKVFGKVGEIMEVRMTMDGQTGKNKGYAFLRYKNESQAKKAVSEFPKVEICGRLCGAATLESNDTIYLGNIDKNWKKEDVIRLLQGIGIEKIDTVTVMPDPHNANANRGFAFLVLETNKDAYIAYRKLQKTYVGKHGGIKVAWAEPLNDPDEEEMQKVPVKVSLARPVKKSKLSKGSSVSTSTEKENSNQVQRDMKTVVTYNQKSPEGVTNSTGGTRKTSSYELQALREQSAWEHGKVGYGRAGPMVQDYSHSMAGAKRPFSLMGEDASSSDVRGYPHLHYDTYPFSSYAAFLHAMPGPSLPYYQHTYPGYLSDFHGLSALPSNFTYHGIPPCAGSMYFGYR